MVGTAIGVYCSWVALVLSGRLPEFMGLPALWDCRVKWGVFYPVKPVRV